MELTFEEWRHTYADVFETDDAARTAWIVASNRGYRVGVSDTRALLAAHSAGAQEPVAWQFRERGTDHWVACPEKPTHLSDRDFEKRPLYTQPQPITDAARDVLAERYRQVTAEGWTPAHDDEHTGCSLAVAAACYALFAAADNSDSADAWLQEWRKTARYLWPYDKEWQKTTTPRRDLVKAGALILAEIERLDRATGE